MSDREPEQVKRVQLLIGRLRLDKYQDTLAAEAFERLRNDWNEAGLVRQPEVGGVQDARGHIHVDWPVEEHDPCARAKQLLIQALAHVQVAHRIYWRTEDEPGRADSLDRYLAITLSQLDCREAWAAAIPACPRFAATPSGSLMSMTTSYCEQGCRAAA